MLISLMAVVERTLIQRDNSSLTTKGKPYDNQITNGKPYGNLISMG
ncbi:hypothetical protein M2125_000646 [Polynucleobacter sphagniphilus]|nr:hypothetical protein [Polynucleobacter sphagniphilus]